MHLKLEMLDVVLLNNKLCSTLWNNFILKIKTVSETEKKIEISLTDLYKFYFQMLLYRTIVA
jgi:hypothetical protein